MITKWKKIVIIFMNLAAQFDTNKFIKFINLCITVFSQKKKYLAENFKGEISG